MPFFFTFLPLCSWCHPTLLLVVPLPHFSHQSSQRWRLIPHKYWNKVWPQLVSSKCLILCFVFYIRVVLHLSWTRISGQAHTSFYLLQKCTKSDSIRLNAFPLHLFFYVVFWHELSFAFVSWSGGNFWWFPRNWLVLLFSTASKFWATWESKVHIFKFSEQRRVKHLLLNDCRNQTYLSRHEW